jgi:hypothetical protein
MDMPKPPQLGCPVPLTAAAVAKPPIPSHEVRSRRAHLGYSAPGCTRGVAVDWSRVALFREAIPSGTYELRPLRVAGSLIHHRCTSAGDPTRSPCRVATAATSRRRRTCWTASTSCSAKSRTPPRGSPGVGARPGPAARGFRRRARGRTAASPDRALTLAHRGARPLARISHHCPGPNPSPARSAGRSTSGRTGSSQQRRARAFIRLRVMSPTCAVPQGIPVKSSGAIRLRPMRT